MTTKDHIARTKRPSVILAKPKHQFQNHIDQLLIWTLFVVDWDHDI